MESFWTLLLLTFTFAVAGNHIVNHWRRRCLPPGPPYFPVIGNLLWLRNSINNIDPIVGKLLRRYGPVISLHFGSRAIIFVTDRSITHKFLVQHGATFATRPPPLETLRLIGNDRYNINSAVYGSVWRVLRRNLMTEILNPVRVKIYSPRRKWVLGVLLDKIKLQAEETNGEVVVKEAIQHAMFCLLVSMCFGEKFGEEKNKEIEKAQVDLLTHFDKLQVFAFVPRFGKYLFVERWKKLMGMRKRQRDVFLPLIASRREMKGKLIKQESSCFEYCYVDSLLDITIPEENERKLTDDEIVSLCSEFFNAGTDTTSTALQWIMANLVKHQEIQANLVEDINRIVPSTAEIVEEEDLP